MWWKARNFIEPLMKVSSSWRTDKHAPTLTENRKTRLLTHDPRSSITIVLVFIQKEIQDVFKNLARDLGVSDVQRSASHPSWCVGVCHPFLLFVQIFNRWESLPHKSNWNFLDKVSCQNFGWEALWKLYPMDPVGFSVKDTRPLFFLSFLPSLFITSLLTPLSLLLCLGTFLKTYDFCFATQGLNHSYGERLLTLGQHFATGNYYFRIIHKNTYLHEGNWWHIWGLFRSSCVYSWQRC